MPPTRLGYRQLLNSNCQLLSADPLLYVRHIFLYVIYAIGYALIKTQQLDHVNKKRRSRDFDAQQCGHSAKENHNAGGSQPALAGALGRMNWLLQL